MARPTVPDRERRTELLQVRLTPSEKRALNRAAADAGVTLTAYARALLTGTKPRAKSPKQQTMKALLYELSSIATNLGQLSEATGQSVYADWARYVGGDLTQRVNDREDLISLFDEHMERINAAGHWVNTLAKRANMGKALDLEEVADALKAVRRVLKPIHEAVADAPPGEGDAV